jgi:ferredoxin
MKLEVTPGVCIGAGQCVLAAPALFNQTEEGTVLLLRDPGTDDEAATRDAVALCPSQALRLAED